MQYIELNSTESVQTQSVPALDDGLSAPIHVTFPYGDQILSSVNVRSLILLWYSMVTLRC